MPGFTSESGREIRGLLDKQRMLAESAGTVDEGVAGIIKYLEDVAGQLLDTLTDQGVDVSEIEKAQDVLMKAIQKAVAGA